MTPDQWAMLGAIGEIAGAIFTFMAVLTSLFVSIKALREVQLDRRLNKAPYLAFELGGQRYPIEFQVLNEEDQIRESADELENLSWIGLKTDDGKITHKYHGLKNFGLGPAIHARITWIAEKIRVGTESFLIDDSKLSEPKYSQEFNSIPATPSHILPGQEATFFRIPAFIQRDLEKKITEVTGIIEIEYLDLFKQRHITRQQFYLFTGYKEDPPHIHFTFSDIQFDETDEWASARRA